MARLDESAAFIAYQLRIGKKLWRADLERIARRNYLDPEKLLNETVALCEKHGIRGKARLYRQKPALMRR